MASQQQSSNTPISSRDSWQMLYLRVHELFSCRGRDLIWASNRSTWVKHGRVAGYETDKGYKRVEFDGSSYPVHAIVFLYHNGYMPSLIDHIDGDRLNNAISNLRECSLSQNGQNRKINKNSSSGVKGVSWHRASGQWRARVQVENKRVELGGFDDLDLAELVVMEAREKYHGEFCRHE